MKSFTAFMILLILIYIFSAANANPLGDHLWVPCYLSNNVYKINVVTHDVEAIIPVGRGPSGIAVGQGIVYVTCRHSSRLYCISKISDIVVDSFDLSPAMAFGIEVALDSRNQIYVVGRSNADADSMDMARIAKLSRSGEILSDTNLMRIQAACDWDESNEMAMIGIAIDEPEATIPWQRSWDVHTGIMVLNTDDFSFSNFEFNPRQYGYRGPGAAYDENDVGWSSGEREERNYLISHYGVGNLQYHNLGYWDYGPQVYGDVAIDNFGNIWTGDAAGNLMKYSPDSSVVRTFQLGNYIKGITIDKYGYIWVALYPDNALRKFDYDGQSVGPAVRVGNLPMGFGDMTGYKFGRTMTAIDEPGDLPDTISILTAYPNPFNAASTISYSVIRSGKVNLSIYDILGRKVTTLFDGDQKSGEYGFVWNAGSLASSVYFARLEIAGKFESIKLNLIK